ncbi:nucleotide-diphospho-sugar transferase [Exidia glandulosa HHB12029]|uniref:Translation initiation factor eIF2B subunit epsilon n=1 Tax=Exidia glandulosa HHB12029 TaxID=1314781 RepID=A0A165B135_EXIGL|nr:nucleotide-diphospho-sugar transferase [Exidia glandulosa HHB12029]
MPPKAAKAKEVEDVQEEQDVLQALILADSFNERFKPLTTGLPRCLVPVCNAPLLDWTFESLALAGVQEIFVLCRSHTDQVQEAIRKSRWSQPGSGIKIAPIVTQDNVFSVGAAMRDVYAHQVIKSDFVLVMGDVVSSVRIDEVVREHKARRKTNKDALMSIIVKEAGASHRTRPRGETSVFVLDSDTAEVLHYEGVAAVPETTRVSIPREKLKGHRNVDIRNDLIDCGIDVCAAEVLSLFQDEFDWQDMRRHFVRGVLTSDLLMKNIYCHVAREGYAARVKDTKSYAAISKDVLARWAFPLVPDGNHPGGQHYEHLRGHRYISQDKQVTLSRTCKVGNNTLVGGGSRIDDSADVAASVLGAECVVGKGTTVRDSYLWDGVQLGAGCFVEHSIIASGVKILDGTRIGKGCLIGSGVVVGPNSVIKPFSRVSSEPPEEEDAEDAATALGPGSRGYLWPETGDDDVDDDFESEANLRYLCIGADNYSDEEHSDDESNASTFSSPASSVLSLPESNTSGQLSTPGLALLGDGSSRAVEFESEAQLSLERAYNEGHRIEDAAIELKTLRMSSNVEQRQVLNAVVGFIVDKIELVEGNVPQQKAVINKIVQRWGPLLNSLGAGDGEETVELLQKHCSRPKYPPLFAHVLSAFYMTDVVGEDDIMAWYKDPKSKDGDDESKAAYARECWKWGGQLAQHLAAQESDDDEEDDDSE